MKPFSLRSFLLLLSLSFIGCQQARQDWTYDVKTNDLTVDIYPSGGSLSLLFDDYIKSFTAYQHNCSPIRRSNVLSHEEIDTCSNTQLASYVEEYLGDLPEEITDETRAVWQSELKELMSRMDVRPKNIQDLSLVDDLYNNEDIKVNGAAYEGKIIGFHKGSGKKIFEYDPGNSKNRPIPGAASIDGQSEKKCTLWTAEGEMKVERVYVEMRTRKPVIYLYPTQEQAVQLELDIQHGHLTTTYPKYLENKGWTVTAKPDGTLFDPITQKEYYALYWEADSRYRYDMAKGFVVKGRDSAEFLDEKLAELGLNRREANEFIIYWLPILEENKYNLIHFSTDEYMAENRMQISPKPETLIRLLMVYSVLDKPIEIEPQQFEPIQRKGFTVVEWGGQEQLLNDY